MKPDSRYKKILGSNKNFRKPKNVKLIPANILTVLNTVKIANLIFNFLLHAFDKLCLYR